MQWSLTFTHTHNPYYLLPTLYSPNHMANSKEQHWADPQGKKMVSIMILWASIITRNSMNHFTWAIYCGRYHDVQPRCPSFWPEPLMAPTAEAWCWRLMVASNWSWPMWDGLPKSCSLPRAALIQWLHLLQQENKKSKCGDANVGIQKPAFLLQRTSLKGPPSLRSL